MSSEIHACKCDILFRKLATSKYFRSHVMFYYEAIMCNTLNLVIIFQYFLAPRLQPEYLNALRH